jgi:hypothetical protein
MPAEERVRLNDVQRMLPVTGEASQQHESNPVAVRELWSLDLSPENDQLLA